MERPVERDSEAMTDRGIRMLVLVEDYPDLSGRVSMQYVHTRNVYYQRAGFQVTVVNFRASAGYRIDGVPVITLADYESRPQEYDILILHAANIRHHYRFLQNYGSRFSHFVFFFHGHEVLRVRQVYPRPYPFVRDSRVKAALQNVYDTFKLRFWHKYLLSVMDKSQLVFVSQWMMDQFVRFTRISPEQMRDHCHITYNGVGKTFETNSYRPDGDKEYDFVTIRSNLDGSKYCIDFVNRLAEKNPDLRFLVVGKGSFFQHYAKAPNITWQDRTLDHQQIVSVLQSARCALMPTRADAQGLMMCEMATFGIPVITSDLPVCHEALDSFGNVAMIENGDIDADIAGISRRLSAGAPYPKNDRYFSENTCRVETELLSALRGSGS